MTIHRMLESGGELFWFKGALINIRVSWVAGEDRVSVVEHFMPYGMSPPLHVHRNEDEVFHILEGSMRIQVDGVDDIGQPRTFFVLVPVPEGSSGSERLDKLGLLLMQDGDRTLVDMVTYGSPAADLGFDFDQEIVEILAPVDRWAKEWMWIPGLAVLLLVIGLQWRRRPADGAHARA